MSDEPCPFCEINTGRAPATFVHEWSDAIAIVPLNPVADGHTLVIPKTHVADFADDPERRAMPNASCRAATGPPRFTKTRSSANGTRKTCTPRTRIDLREPR